jgi:hypothetical protein
MTQLSSFSFDQAKMRFDVSITHRGAEICSTVAFVEVENHIFQVIFGDDLKVLELQHRLMLKKVLWKSIQGENIELPASLE